MKKTPVCVAALASLLLFVAPVLSADEAYPARLSDQTACEENGGEWNTCPPTDCQKEYPDSFVCEDTCGQASCALPASSNGPQNESICEDAGGWWNTCPLSDCQKAGNDGCSFECGLPVCEFTPFPTDENECTARNGEWIECPRLIECDLEDAEICADVCGEPRCRFYTQEGHPQNETQCEVWNGWWNPNTPDPECEDCSRVVDSCEVVAPQKPIEAPTTEEECTPQNGWWWDNCPPAPCADEGCDACGEPICNQLDEDHCSDAMGNWQDETCIFEIDEVADSEDLCQQKDWYWETCVDQEDCLPHCTEWTEVICEELDGIWNENEETKCALLQKPPFTDIDQHKYQKAISYLYQNRIIDGYEDGTFKPDNAINRAEFTKIIVETFYTEEDRAYCMAETAQVDTEKIFEDVPRSEWYAEYICVAQWKGLVNGHPDGTFKPNELISWVEALKITLEGFEIAIAETEGEWYQKYLDYAMTNDLELDDIFALDQSVSRGQMAEMIFKIKQCECSKE